MVRTWSSKVMVKFLTGPATSETKEFPKVKVRLVGSNDLPANSDQNLPNGSAGGELKAAAAANLFGPMKLHCSCHGAVKSFSPCPASPAGLIFSRGSCCLKFSIGAQVPSFCYALIQLEFILDGQHHSLCVRASRKKQCINGYAFMH